MTIYYWPDGCWCEASELPSMSHKPDNFTPLVLPDDTDRREIDILVQELIGD